MGGSSRYGTLVQEDLCPVKAVLDQTGQVEGGTNRWGDTFYSMTDLWIYFICKIYLLPAPALCVKICSAETKHQAAGKAWKPQGAGPFEWCISCCATFPFLVGQFCCQSPSAHRGTLKKHAVNTIKGTEKPPMSFNNFTASLVFSRASTELGTTSGISGTSSKLWPRAMTRAGMAEAASAALTARRRTLRGTRECHLRNTLVGANMRPPRHIFPKAPCPDRCVPPPETRGIRATARPVPQDSALVWWPARLVTAYGILLFLAMLLWTNLSKRERTDWKWNNREGKPDEIVSQSGRKYFGEGNSLPLFLNGDLRRHTTAIVTEHSTNQRTCRHLP